MATTAPLPDLSNIDPRLAALPPGVLAAVQARLAGNQPVSAPPVDATGAAGVSAPPMPLPASPVTQSPVATPPNAAAMSAPAPLSPTLSAPIASPANDPTQAASPSSPSANPGPIKKALTGFLYGLGQKFDANHHVATDYENRQLAIQQQNADTNTDYKNQQGDLIAQQAAAAQAGLTPMPIPDLPQFGAFAGKTLPQSVAVPLLQKVIGYQSAADIAASRNASAETVAAGKNATALQGKQLQYGPESYLRHGFKDIGGHAVEYDKGTGAILRDMGPSNSLVVGASNANARARAFAAYSPFETIDTDGSPMTISKLQALSGPPAMQMNTTGAVKLASDRVGIQQYQDILDNKITPNLAVLNDPQQRAIIAHTLSEADNNPGVFQAILTSAAQQGLSPAGAELAAGIMQGREFGGVARKYGGNMNGTEGLMNRIMANQASPLNAQQLNTDLIQNDRAFTSRALGALGTITKNSQPAKGAPAAVTPNQSNGTTYAPGFHPLK